MRRLAVLLGVALAVAIAGTAVLVFSQPPAPLAVDGPYAAARADILDAMPGTGGVVMLGDSLTDYGRWDELLPKVRARNRGVSGDGSADLLARLEPVIASKPERVFLLIGTNDILRQIAPEDTAGTVGTIVSRLKDAGAAVVVQSVIHLGRNFPSARAAVDTLNAQLATVAESEGAAFLDLNAALAPDGYLLPAYDWGDGVHLNGEGYLVWRDVVLASLRADGALP